MRLTRRQFLATAAAVPVTAGLATPAGAATQDVSIQNFAFSPASLSISAGDSVRFTNRDSAAHTATFEGDGPDTGRLRRGEAATLTFATPGTYPYHCAFHGAMRGTIVVT